MRKVRLLVLVLFHIGVFIGLTVSIILSYPKFFAAFLFLQLTGIVIGPFWYYKEAKA